MGIRQENQAIRAFGALLQARAFLVEELEKDLVAKRALPLAFFEALARLADAPEGRMRMQDLAAASLLSKSGITRLVDRMQAASLVRRAACESDRRVTYAEITPAGRKALRGAVTPHLAGVDRLFSSHLSEDELRQLRELLEKVLRANGQMPDAACDAMLEPELSDAASA